MSSRNERNILFISLRVTDPRDTAAQAFNLRYHDYHRLVLSRTRCRHGKGMETFLEIYKYLECSLGLYPSSCGHGLSLMIIRWYPGLSRQERSCGTTYEPTACVRTPRRGAGWRSTRGGNGPQDVLREDDGNRPPTGSTARLSFLTTRDRSKRTRCEIRAARLPSTRPGIIRP